MNHANHVVDAFEGTLEKQFGFAADHKLPLWHNAARRLENMRLDAYKLGRLGNIVVRDLLRSQMPSGTRGLLELGLNYRIKRPSTTETTNGTFSLLQNDLRCIYAFKDSPPLDDQDYTKKLYFKSDYAFKPASDEIEEAILKF